MFAQAPTICAAPDWNSYTLTCAVHGVEATVPMETGPDGFLVGKFPHGTATTDIPNLVLAKRQSSLQRLTKKMEQMRRLHLRQKPAVARRA